MLPDRGLRLYMNRGESMPDKDPHQEIYNIAIQQVRYEGQVLWQRFSAFLWPHTIFLAFVLNSAAAHRFAVYSPGVFWPSVIGLPLCLPWLAVYERSAAYYNFRIAQARAVEPPGWQLLGGTAQDFSAGTSVSVNGKS